MSRRCENLNKLLRVTAYILRFFKFKGKKKTYLDSEDLKTSEAYWIKEAMKLSIANLKKGNYTSLRGYKREDGLDYRVHQKIKFLFYLDAHLIVFSYWYAE